MRNVSLFLPTWLRSSVSRSSHCSEQQANDPPQEHTHALVWIATSFRPRPRMHVRMRMRLGVRGYASACARA